MWGVCAHMHLLSGTIINLLCGRRWMRVWGCVCTWTHCLAVWVFSLPGSGSMGVSWLPLLRSVSFPQTEKQSSVSNYYLVTLFCYFVLHQELIKLSLVGVLYQNGVRDLNTRLHSTDLLLKHFWGSYFYREGELTLKNISIYPILQIYSYFRQSH